MRSSSASSGYSKRVPGPYCISRCNIWIHQRLKLSPMPRPTTWTRSFMIRSVWILAMCMRVLVLWRVENKSKPHAIGSKKLQRTTALREKVMTEAHSSPFTIHPGQITSEAVDVTDRWRFLCEMVVGMNIMLVEFAYNNSWHASIKQQPFELFVWSGAHREILMRKWRCKEKLEKARVATEELC
ncbi:hypothetical protein Tco_0228505 [Tanacetum coccineum]